MPYESLLPERYQGTNERIDDHVQTRQKACDMSARQLTIRILRYNPQEPGSTPRMQEYVVEEADGMTLFIALEEIRERQDPSLQYDFVCRAGICGSCAMTINGRPTLACRTLTRNLGDDHHARPHAGVRVDRRPVCGYW